ncbi:MAG: hypothetical protein KJN63_10075, partial [Acidimicrobiia bacterium]|nr:hypothetical protein [Acidimicrobiia bacterium]
LHDYPSLSGVRVDHVDGLADPDTYLRWLRNLIGPDRLLLVEKILLGSERLPARWPVDGTTGYEFARLVDRLLLNETGYRRVLGHYRELTDDRREFEEIEAGAIHEVLRGGLAPDVARIARTVATDPRLEGDRGVDSVVQLAGSFRRYRTYLPEGSESDLAVLTDARNRAVSNRHRTEVESIDALVSVLAAPSTEADRKVLSLFQQLTGPALAKGIEDRAIYRHLPLAALNEVGASPVDPSAGVDDFHRWAAQAAEDAPRSMLTTTTHDTKRSGDVRARLLTLSDHPDEWRTFCNDWIDFDADRLPVHRIDRYMILQHAVGAWPISTDRLNSYVNKALREGAERTSWIDVDHDYERTVGTLVGSLLGDRHFGAAVDVLLSKLDRGSLARSLSQILLRLTSPGFGDLYRGDEIQKLSLVDPDNRRRLDWAGMAELVEEARSLDVAAAINVSASVAKMSLIIRVLQARANQSTDPTYEALRPVGMPSNEDALAFRYGNVVVFIAHRLLENQWRAVELGLPPGEWTDVLVDGRRPLSGTVSVDQIVAAQLPLRLLTRV